jgi:predicted MPP superfamily phosphohydrolase
MKIKKDNFLIEPKNIDIKIDKKFSCLNNFKILHISDLHIDKKTKPSQIKNLIKNLNSIDTNIIAITGDLIDCPANKIKNRLRLFKKLNKPTYFVSGNHDLYHGYNALISILKDIDIKIIDNKIDYLEYYNNKLSIIGLSDLYSKFFKIKRDEDKLINSIKDENIFKLFLAHQPKDYIYAKKSNSNLFLCGHTHSGQVFPFNILVSIVQPFLKGIHYKDDLAIYVNSGLGTWGIKYRFLADNEITILRLQTKN